MSDVKLYQIVLLLTVLFLLLSVPVDAGMSKEGEPGSRHRIVVNIARCSLTLFSRGSGGSWVPQKEYPAATAVRGLSPRPLGTGRVTRIEFNPSWHPTAYSREIYRQKGITLPAVVPPGHPLNYMGAVKISLSHRTSRGAIYRIHGTNNPSRVGKRVTGGCACLSNNDVLELARTISVGTEVEFVP